MTPTREQADRAIADMLAFTAAESGHSEREIHQLMLSARGLTTDRERQAAALLEVRRDLGLTDALLTLASDVSQADRMEYAKKGWALGDGSYPIPDVGHLKAAAVLCRSKHGDYKAAEKLIAKRARELGVPNPLTTSSDVQATSSAQARRLQRAGLSPDDIQLSRDGAAAMTYDQTADEPDAGDVALAVQDVAMRHPALFDFGKVSRVAVPCSTLALSRQRERLYDDDTLALTSTVQSQRDLDEYLLHLSRSSKVGQKLLGLAGPDLTDVLDKGAPSVSDLTQEVVQPAQGDLGDPFAISEKLRTS